MRRFLVVGLIVIAMFTAAALPASAHHRPNHSGGPRTTTTTTSTTTTTTTTTTPPPTGCQTNHSGNLNANVAGVVYDGYCITGGTFVCNAANVTLRSSRITRGGILANQSCTGLRATDVEIDCGHVPGTSGFSQDWGFVGQNIELRAMDIHDCENGVFIDNGVAVYDSYIHGPLDDSQSEAHSDGVQLWAGASDVVVQNNVIDYRGTTTSAMISGGNEPDPNFGYTTDLLVTGNLFGGGAYTTYLPNQRGSFGFTLDNVRYINNRWMENAFAFGYCTGTVSEMTEWSGNVVDETGELITSC